jgi:Family of unknown function (DUF6459)
MTALTVSPAPALRRLPIPLAEPRPALRVVTDRPLPVSDAQGVLVLSGSDRAEGDAGSGPQRVPPPAEAWARQFVQAALEVSNGRRPVSQLVRWTTDEVFALLCRRAALAQRIERPGGVAPVTVVRSLRVCRPADGVAEASAVVVDRGRVRAVALRLEDLAGRWRVCALEIG